MESVSTSITTIDFAIIEIYFAVVLAIGIWVPKTTETGTICFSPDDRSPGASSAFRCSPPTSPAPR